MNRRIYILEAYAFGQRTYTLASSSKIQIEVEKSRIVTDFLKKDCPDEPIPASEREALQLAQEHELRLTELALPDLARPNDKALTLDDLKLAPLSNHVTMLRDESANFIAIYSYSDPIALRLPYQDLTYVLAAEHARSTTTAKHIEAYVKTGKIAHERMQFVTEPELKRLLSILALN